MQKKAEEIKNRTDNIEYNSDWHSASNPEYYEPTIEEISQTFSDDYPNENEIVNGTKQKTKKIKKQWLLIIQITTCIIILIAVLIIKQSEANLFKQISDWYKTQINNSLFITDLPNGLLGGSITATDDTSTADETP